MRKRILNETDRMRNRNKVNKEVEMLDAE